MQGVHGEESTKRQRCRAQGERERPTSSKNKETLASSLQVQVEGQANSQDGKGQGQRMCMEAGKQKAKGGKLVNGLLNDTGGAKPVEMRFQHAIAMILPTLMDTPQG